MRRFVSFQFACVSVAIGLGSALPTAAEVLVAPRVHAVAVEQQAAASFELLLVQEIERRIDGRLLLADASSGARPCVEPSCAGRRARRLGAHGALLADLARLGEGYVATLRGVDRAGRIVWSEQRTAHSVEGLHLAAAELAAARFGGELGADFAHGHASGGVVGGSGRPRRGWNTQGPRVGTIGPLGDSYAGVGGLLSLAYVWRHQTTRFNVEVVPALGVAWGGDVERDGAQARDWSLLDLFIAWTPLPGDISPFVGAGLGLHAIALERTGDGTAFTGTRKEGQAGVSFALGCGLLLFRTYDFQLSLDLRYQHFLHDFETVGGGGARGFTFCFGIQHR